MSRSTVLLPLPDGPTSTSSSPSSISSVIVSSIHKPIARLREDPVAVQAVAASDAIITVSAVQARELSVLRSAGSIHAIPHGVWTSVFRPVTHSDRPRTDVLIVGSFLRDWGGARQVILTLARHGVRSIAVGAGAREHLRDEGVPVQVLPRVSETELARLYDDAAAVLLPFLDATASNALVEAMAAGCPIVCPRFPSLIEEYLGDDLDAFDPGHYDDAAARLLRYTRSPAERTARSRERMARADQFDWARLKLRYQAVYQDVAETAHIAYGLV
jgi:glycosyltransferase involved in cell wall biosynthesis